MSVLLTRSLPALPSQLRYQNLRDMIGFPLAVSLRQVSPVVAVGPRPRYELTRHPRSQRHVLLADFSSLSTTLTMLLDLLATLYTTPIDDRENVAFEEYREAMLEARKALAAAQARASAPRARHDAKQLFIDKEAHLAHLFARHKERLSAANLGRLEHLEKVKAAMAMLHQHVVLPDVLYGTRPHVAFELYLSRLGHQQQEIVVGCARDLLYRACKERARYGRALDPVQGVRRLPLAALPVCTLAVELTRAR